jgi:nucleotide-binding universal stress UspA family protein
VTAEPVKRLVVATDFSDTAERALAVGIRFAKLMGAALDLVHVYYLPSPGVLSPMPGVVPAPPPGPDELKTIEQRFAALGAKAREAGVHYLSTNLVGDPPDEINSYARRIGADLIVVGTHGRTGIRRALLGSVAEQVVRRARCPVLVVPGRSPDSD